MKAVPPIAPCREVSFDIPSTAGQYATLTGVLAGFAFTALVMLVTTRIRGEQAADFGQAGQVLTVAFVGLLMSSLAYSVLKGVRFSTGRPASEEVILGLGFAASTILLMYAIALILDAVDASNAAPVGANRLPAFRLSFHFRWLFAFIIAPLAVIYVALGAIDYAQARPGDSDWMAPAGCALAVVPLCAATFGVVYRRRRVVRPDRSLAVRRFAWSAISAMLTSAALFALSEGVYPVCDTLPRTLVFVPLALTAAVMAAASWRFATD